MGDPRFVEVPVDRLAGKPYAAEMAAEIRAGKKADVPRLNAGAPVKDTTHVSVVDAEGNCVTMTHSLGMPSGVVTRGLGFMYNGCMGVFDPRPGRAGSLAPGKARFSSVVPPSCGRRTARTWSSAPRGRPRSRWACCRSCSTRSTST